MIVAKTSSRRPPVGDCSPPSVKNSGRGVSGDTTARIHDLRNIVSLQVRKAYQGKLMFELQEKIVRDASVDGEHSGGPARQSNPLQQCGVAWPEARRIRSRDH